MVVVVVVVSYNNYVNECHHGITWGFPQCFLMELLTAHLLSVVLLQ